MSLLMTSFISQIIKMLKIIRDSPHTTVLLTGPEVSYLTLRYKSNYEDLTSNFPSNDRLLVDVFDEHYPDIVLLPICYFGSFNSLLTDRNLYWQFSKWTVAKASPLAVGL